MDLEYEREKAWLLAEKFGGVETPEFFDDLERLKTGEPLAYIIGHVPFLGATIYLDYRPLIPRPETEYWTKQAIADMQSQERSLKVLDLCAGSGCIGVAVLTHIPNVHVNFAEIDVRHHKTIEKNILLNTSGAFQIFGGNLFSEIPTGTRYDYILSNPPYIDPARTERIGASVLLHEPHGALFGGDNGLSLILSIIDEAPHYLTEGGILIIEHEPEQVEAIATKARERGYASVEPQKDQYGVSRYTLLKYS